MYNSNMQDNVPEIEIKEKKKPRERPYYVNAEEFGREIKKFYETNTWTPYLIDAITKMSNGVAHRYNFVRYTWKEDMIATAKYNMTCALIKKFYKIDSKFSAFGYFNAIAWNACVEVIKKENKNKMIIREYKAHMYKELLNSNLDKEHSAYVEDSLRELHDDIEAENERKQNAKKKEEYNATKPKRSKVK